MADDRDGHRTRESLVVGGLGLAMVLCCGLPLLLAGGALGGAGALLGQPWLIVTAAAVVTGVVLWRMRRTNGQVGGSCCSLESSAQDDLPHGDPDPSVNRDPER